MILSTGKLKVSHIMKKRAFMCGKFGLWTILVAIRLTWAVLPQMGYIHPDEFFQSAEVVAGDAFNITVTRTWEFDAKFPLRSMIIPQFLFMPIFKSLQWCHQRAAVIMLTSKRILIAQRFVMACLSLIIDFCVYKISKLSQVDQGTTCVLVAGSYVMLTYQIHSFSNSTETVLAVMLLWILLRDVKNSSNSACESVKSVTDILKSCDNLANKNGVKQNLDEYENSGNVIQDLHSSTYNLRKRQFKKTSDIVQDNNQAGLKGIKKSEKESSFVMKNEDETQNMDGQVNTSTRTIREISEKSVKAELDFASAVNIISMAVINIAGIFNRPTFVAFSVLPFLWWTSHLSLSSLSVIKLSFFLSVSLMTTIVFITFDSCYFNNLSIVSLLTGEKTSAVQFMDNLVFTPLNFMLYNVNVDNLKQHGEHPFYLHLLVNIPLLFGPLAYYVFKYLLKEVCNLSLRGYSMLYKLELSQKRTSTDSIFIPWIWFICIPVLLLSLFPHQEARFLLPLLPFVIFLKMAKSHSLNVPFTGTFLIFNILLSFVFGVFHQGGMLSCMFRLSELSQNSLRDNTKLYFLFSHTYMPPKHLLLSNTSDVKVIDYQGLDLKEVAQEIVNLLPVECGARDTNIGNVLCRNESKIYLGLPGTVKSKFDIEMNALEVNNRSSFKVKVYEKFFPHMSLDAPPSSQCFTDIVSFYDCMSLFLIEFRDKLNVTQG